MFLKLIITTTLNLLGEKGSKPLLAGLWVHPADGRFSLCGARNYNKSLGSPPPPPGRSLTSWERQVRGESNALRAPFSKRTRVYFTVQLLNRQEITNAAAEQ